MSDVEVLVELPGVYDGWSVAVMKDGTMQNRWADSDGKPTPGNERRWAAAEKWIKEWDSDE